MRALILGSGPDLRPWSLTDLPTSPITEWHRGNLIAAGIRDLRLVQSDFPANRLGMMVEASTWLEGDDCLILEGDHAFSTSLLRAVAAGTEEIEVAYQPSHGARLPNEPGHPERASLKITCYPDGTLQSVLPTRTRGHRETGYCLGLWRMTPRGWRKITELLASLSAAERHRLDVGGLLGRLAREGMQIRMIPVPGGWRVLGNPEQVLLEDPRPLRRGLAMDSPSNRLAA